GGGLRPRRRAVNLVELVELSTKRLARVLDATEVRIDADADLPAVLVDHTMFEQVVTNLLENAARHSPAGCPIEIDVRATGGGRAGGRSDVELIVRDHGAGVPAGQRQTVFEPFRSSGATSGVGLAICRAVVTAHGG